MVKIDQGFKALIPPLSPEEFSQLEQNILAEGCRDALVVWGEVLLDGHNRFEICRKHGIEFSTTSLEFTDREAAADWIDKNQLGRRNLTPDQMSLLRGRRYNRVKKQGERTDLTSGQSGTKLTTAESLAEQHGVSPRTIKRDGQFAEAVEKVKAVEPEISRMVGEGTAPPKKSVIEAARVVEREPEKAKEILKPHVSNNSGDNEWYTPKPIAAAARSVLGKIDIDPASSYEANAVIGAKEIFTAEDNGLEKDWAGSLWMNPPYASDLIGKFIEKLVASVDSGQVKEALVLVNNATETKWFNRLASVSSYFCFPTGRIKFWHPRKESTPLQGQAVAYIGNNGDAFENEFSKFGIIMRVC